MGKRLICDFIRGQMPQEAREIVAKEIKYSGDELIDIMCDSSEPSDAEGKRRAFIRDFYAIMQTESGPKPAKEFYTKVEEDPLYYYKKEPNSIFFTTKSKADRERIMNGYGNNGNPYTPTMETIMLITRVLELNEEESRELFFAAFPYFPLWMTAIRDNLNLDKTDELMEEHGYSTLTKP